jgi:hypothetical protein
MLPLVSLKDGENTAIDLSTLTQSGDSVIPGHNPLGDEINISESEIAGYKELGGYYESLAKNIDANNDGVPDILNKTQLRISSHFSLYGGHWGLDSTPHSAFDTAQINMNYAVRIEGNISMAPANGNQVALSGPADSAYTDINTASYLADKDCFITFFRRPGENPVNSPQGPPFLPFKKGTYSFTLTGAELYTLNYSNIDARYYLVIAAPTLHQNAAGQVTSISIAYKRLDGTIVNPYNIVTCLQLQITDKNGGRTELGSLYERTKTDRTLTDYHNVTLQTPLDRALLVQVNVNYNDLLGNEYDVLWRK